MRDLWLAMVLVLLSWSTEAGAQDCSKSFFPERPGATNGHWSQQSGCAQLEAGALVTRSPDTTFLAFPTLFRFGLGAGFELRATTDLVSVDISDDGPSGASAPRTGVELKFMGLRAEGRVPGVGVLLQLNSVTNGDFVDELQMATSGLMDWQLFEGFWWAVNLGLSTTNGGPPAPHRRGVFRASTVVWYDFVELMSGYVNGAGSTVLVSDEQSWSQLLGGGLAFYPDVDKLQLDLSADVEVTGDQHPVILGAGVAVGF